MTGHGRQPALPPTRRSQDGDLHDLSSWRGVPGASNLFGLRAAERVRAAAAVREACRAQEAATDAHSGSAGDGGQYPGDEAAAVEGRTHTPPRRCEVNQ